MARTELRAPNCAARIARGELRGARLLVLHHVALVEEDDELRQPDLPREQHVLARLRHRPVGRRHDEDRAVHRRRAGDHVLDVVGVARAVNVRVVALGRLVLDVRRVDRDAARLLLGRLVDVGVPLEVGAAALRLAHHLGDGRGQGGFAVVDVADRADVHVRLRALPGAVRHVAERADERRRGNSPSGRRGRGEAEH